MASIYPQGPPSHCLATSPVLQHSNKAELATLFCQATDEGSLISRQSQGLAALKVVPWPSQEHALSEDPEMPKSLL